MMSYLRNISVSNLRRSIRLREKIDALERELNVILEAKGTDTASSKIRKGMSAAGRARIAAAQRKRWAKAKRNNKDSAETKPKRKASVATRKRLAAAAKARWAKAKAAGKKTL